MNFPYFKYHPDPLKTGAISKSEKECVCCRQKRGYIYTGNVYGESDFEEQLCPWCIHSGVAAEKYDLCFTDYHSLIKAGLSEEIIENVSKRTPGYICWQSEDWLSHCNDACAFIGDAEKDTLKQFNMEQVKKIFGSDNIDEDGWLELLNSYEPAGDPAIYHFKCIHCNAQLFNHDCS